MNSAQLVPLLVPASGLAVNQGSDGKREGWGYQGPQRQGLGLTWRTGTLNATCQGLVFLTWDGGVQVPRPTVSAGDSGWWGTSRDAPCHLQCSGRLLGGRGCALGRPGKGVLWRWLTLLP